jgi:hypothetical protein
MSDYIPPGGFPKPTPLSPPPIENFSGLRSPFRPFENIKAAKVANRFENGMSLAGSGDSDVESHFTFVKGEAHVSTYLNLNLMEGQEKKNRKQKRDVDRTYL